MATRIDKAIYRNEIIFLILSFIVFVVGGNNFDYHPILLIVVFSAYVFIFVQTCYFYFKKIKAR